jgi:hypothetical protein
MRRSVGGLLARSVQYLGSQTVNRYAF